MADMLTDHANPRGVSARKLAPLLGVTHTRINQWVAEGKLTRNEHGLFHVEEARREIASHQRAPGVPRAAAPVTGAPAPADPPPTQGPTIARLQQAELALKIEERKVKLDATKGKLIDREKAKALVRRLAQEERDAILAWPARVAPIMAAELGVDAHALHQLLDDHLRAHLSEQGRESPDL